MRTAAVWLVVLAGWAAFRELGDASRFPWADDWTEALLKLVFWVAPCAIALRLWGAATYRIVARELGGLRPSLRGAAFGVAALVPMLAAVPFAGPARSVPVSALVCTGLVGPFAEEVLFRGWLFRQLSRHAGWHPLVALLASATAFGFAHLHTFDPASSSARDLPIVANAAAAGALFAWLVWRWDSLWPAIGLHACLNLSWQIFGGSVLAASGTATAETSAAIAGRLGTIALAVGLTLIFSPMTRQPPVYWPPPPPRPAGRGGI